MVIGFVLSEAGWCENKRGKRDQGKGVFHRTLQTIESVCLRPGGVNERRGRGHRSLYRRCREFRGAEGFENEPLMLKDSLKSLISSIPHDLGRPRL
jgi:hypothetical protein